MGSIWKKCRTPMAKSLRPYFVEFLEDVGPLPRGTYRLLEITETGFSCFFDKVVFGVFKGGKDLYRFTKYQKDLTPTSREDFLTRYKQLELKQRLCFPINRYRKNEPLTFCLLDPSLK